MQAGAHVLGQEHIPRDDRLFGHRRPPGEPELGAQRALVHLRTLGKARLLRVLGDDAAEGLHVLQRATHQQRVGYALAVVAEDAHGRPGLGHRADLAEPLAGEADRDRADRSDRHVAVLLAERGDLLDHSRGVGDR